MKVTFLLESISGKVSCRAFKADSSFVRESLKKLFSNPLSTQNLSATINNRGSNGSMPEWLMGADCKSAGYAYAGSNPARPTFHVARVAQW